jgi:hypothetical protein
MHSCQGVTRDRLMTRCLRTQFTIRQRLPLKPVPKIRELLPQRLRLCSTRRDLTRNRSPSDLYARRRQSSLPQLVNQIRKLQRQGRRARTTTAPNQWQPRQNHFPPLLQRRRQIIRRPAAEGRPDSGNRRPKPLLVQRPRCLIDSALQHLHAQLKRLSAFWPAHPLIDIR